MHGFPIGNGSNMQGFSQSELKTHKTYTHEVKMDDLRRLPVSQPLSALQNAAKARRSFVIAELSEKGKVTFDIEGNSDTGYFIAENLKPQEAVKAVKLLAELSEKGKVTFDIEGNSDIGYFIAEKLEAKEAVELVENISQGNIDLKELGEQGWREVEGGLDRFINSVGDLVNETTISVAAGFLGAGLVAFFGPGGAIATSLVMAVMEKAFQGNYSVTSSILSGELTSLGPVEAILIPLGVGAAANLLQGKTSYE